MTILPEDRPTSVYRYYDRNGVLLYVGITSRGVKRNREHNDDKEWWVFVHRQGVEHFPTRRAALAREKELIRQYRPPFNKQHNPGHELIRAAYFQQGQVVQKLRPAEYQVSKVARRLLTITEHRLPLSLVSREPGRAFYRAAAKMRPLADAIDWRPGIVFRCEGQKGTLSRFVVKDGERVFEVTSKSSGTLPGSVVLKLRSDQNPYAIYAYEVVAA